MGNWETPYFGELREAVLALGGFFNAHLHLDRAGTYHRTVELLKPAGITDGTALPLAGKHAIIPIVHASDAYDPEKLLDRVEPYIRQMVRTGTVRADTVVDTTADRVGMSALQAFRELKERYAGQIDLRIGAYSPLGFRDDEPERWALVESAASHFDFVGLLPERDDRALYPDHIGFEESCRRGISLARSLQRHIHIHVDQANLAYESGSELVARLVEELGHTVAWREEPFVWLVHVISPSAYPEERFQDLATRLAHLNIGVICCPSAALSMRQHRPVLAPTHNSIARVLDLIAAGVHVRLGSDNICDITSPMGTADIMDEVKVLGDSLRYYDVGNLARIAAGLRLDKAGLERLRQHLRSDEDYVGAAVALHDPSTEGSGD